MGKLAIIANLMSAFSPGWLVEALNPNRQTYRNAKIDAKAFSAGRLANSIRSPNVLPTVQESRAQMQKAVDVFDRKGPSLARITDIEVDGAEGPIKARLYSDSTNISAPKPAMVFYHGGGFVQGGLESHHETCAKIAKWWGGIVIAVDYRLAPEHPFPAGVDDAVAAYLWVVKNAPKFGIDPARVGVCGDSAGGCFAAVVAQQVKISGGQMPWFQVLIYPVTDGHLDTLSMNDLKDAYILPSIRTVWYFDLYRGAFKDLDDPKFSPLLAKDFTDLPDTYIITGGFDPLMDDGAFYAEKLQAAGVPTTHRHFPGQIHAFVNMTKVVPEGTQAIIEIVDWLKKRG